MTPCTQCRRELATDEVLYSMQGDPVCATCNTTREINDGLARSRFGMVSVAWFCLVFALLGSCRVTFSGGSGEHVVSFWPVALLALPLAIFALRSLARDPENASRRRVLVLSWFGIAIVMMDVARAFYGWGF